MIPQLLRLTAPEIVVALTGLLVLVLDLSFLRRATLGFRFRCSAFASCGGCVIALIVLRRMAVAVSLPSEILVVNSLTQVVQIALLVLAILTLLLIASARFTEHAGEYCALILFGHDAEFADDLYLHRVFESVTLHPHRVR